MALYNVTHSSDLDGMASAALLMHYHNIPLGNIIFTNHSGKMYHDTFEFVERIPGRGNLLVISDFGMSDPKLERVHTALGKFKKRGNYIIWLDHHPWSDRCVKRLSKLCDIMVVGENKDYCGAELVYRLLCGKSAFGDQLVRLTHFADFALSSGSKKTDFLIDKIGYAIKYLGGEGIRNPDLRKLVSLIANGDIDSKLVNDSYKAYKIEAAPFMRELINKAHVFHVNGLTIAVGFGKKMSHQEACVSMLDRLKCDIAIYVGRENGRGSIRSKRDDVGWGADCLPIALEFKGGGHPLACGFSFEDMGLNMINKKDEAMVIDRVKDIAERLYGKKINYYNQNTAKRTTRLHHNL